MDFLDPKKMRSHSVRLYIGYGLMAVLIGLITIFLVYFASGYNLTTSGNIDQRGLVFVSSTPAGATITIDDKTVGTTNTRLVVSSGQRHFVLNREGYRQWQRDVQVTGSSVQYIAQPFLVPSNLTSTDLISYDSTAQIATQSPDRRWLLLGGETSDAFEILDLSSVTKSGEIDEPIRLTIPSTVLSSGQTTGWVELDWSWDNKHVLLTRSYTDRAGVAQQEIIMLDRTDASASRNLTTTLSLTTDMQLSLIDKKYDRYSIYDQSARLLYTATLNDPSRVLVAERVLVYATHGDDRVLYIRANSDATATTVQAVLREGDKDYVLRELPIGTVYTLNIAQYDNAWLVAVGSDGESKSYLYRNPVSVLKAGDAELEPAFIFRVAGALAADFSSNARFIAVQNGSIVHVYDAEEKASYRVSLDRKLDAPEQVMRWMDGYHFTYVSGGKQYIMDFDGTNEQELVSTGASLFPVFSTDYRYVFSFVSGEDGSGVTVRATALRTAGDM